MNLKESFRYQNFLDTMLTDACSRIQNRTNCLFVTKTHSRTKANPEATDLVEKVEVENYIDNNTILDFLSCIIEEKEKLTSAISTAKASLPFNMDAAIEANKFRQASRNSIKRMLSYKPTKTIESGRDYKFNVEGNQTAYLYDIEITTEEAFDRTKAKNLMSAFIMKSDKVSAEIDAAMVNTTVEYIPLFDVNDTFEDVIAEFKPTT